MRWMKLEPIIQSEVSQKEKHQYSMLTHIYGIQKDGNNDPICKTAKETDIKYRLLDSVGEGEGGMILENSIETCILPYVKQMTIPSSMHETGHSKLVHWDNTQGWDGEGGGSGFQYAGHMYTHGRLMLMYGKKPKYCKVVSLQLR